MIERRNTSKEELDEVIEYWYGRQRGAGWHDEGSLIQFLHVFTPDQIKGAMYIATSTGRYNYFKYMCGILHNWRNELEERRTPNYFDVGE